MSSNLTANHYYKNFIRDYKISIHRYSEKLKTAIEVKNESKSYILDRINIAENIGIRLKDYEEWVNDIYLKDEKLLNAALKLCNIYDGGNKRTFLLMLIKYCKSLENCYVYKYSIDSAEELITMKFKDFRKILKDYYNQVHKCILEGFAYTYGGGIGDLIINRWKTGKNTKPILDYAATNELKKKIVESGQKLFDETEAARYKARGMKYDGKDYRVYKKPQHIYEFTIINSRIAKSKRKLFNRTEYVHNSLRNMTQKEIAEKYTEKEDIYKLDCDMRYKLNILLYNYPQCYLNFVRNDEQSKYKFGTHNCKNRFRFQPKQ